MNNIDVLVAKVKLAMATASTGHSRLPAEILAYHGLNHSPLRHLLNWLGQFSKSYLEIGVFSGTTLLSATHGNKHLKALAVDSWRCKREDIKKKYNHGQDPYECMVERIGRHKRDLPPIRFINGNSRMIRTIDRVKAQGPFDLYFYDGDHSEDSQFHAITDYEPALTHPCVVVIHDWAFPSDTGFVEKDNWTEAVRRGTENALKEIEAKRKVAFREVWTTEKGEAEALVAVLT